MDKKWSVGESAEFIAYFFSIVLASVNKVNMSLLHFILCEIENK